jgi:CheY-like chemotaxis protein
VRMVAFQAQQKGLALSLDIGPDTPAMVRGDLFRLRQILLNLLNNALKFTEHGEVCLRVNCAIGHDGVSAHFSVRDTGIGIPFDRQGLIFEAFSQADRSTARRFGGTGLGLTISSRLVRMMGGELSVKSEAGKGSEFRFTAHLGAVVESITPVESPGQASAPTMAAIDEGPAIPLRILIAEDNLVNQKVASMVLKKRGHASVIANNGREVLSILQGASFDLILMDLEMPEMDGIEATIAIRELEKRTGAHVPIVALTAHALDAYKTRCLDAGMDGYVAKPLRVKQLVETIEGLCKPSLVRQPSPLRV